MMESGLRKVDGGKREKDFGAIRQAAGHLIAAIELLDSAGASPEIAAYVQTALDEINCGDEESPRHGRL